jgi:AraC-like DNA-binding protein
MAKAMASSESCEGMPRSLFWSRPDGQLHVQWYRADAMASYPPHRHAEFNIVVNLKGAVETTQLGGVETAAAGEAMMGSHPGVEHSSRYLVENASFETAGCEAVSLTFSKHFLQQFLPPFGLLDALDGRQPAFLGKIQSQVVHSAAQDAVHELRNKALGYGAVLEGLATRILVETLRVWPRNRVERTAVEAAQCLSRRDHIRALEFMCWCRKEEFRMENLCRFLGTSEEKFTRLFRSSTGDSPASFYNRLLLDRSTELLAESGLSVKATGYQLGFKTPSHFVVAFRRQFGVTPMEYRRESRRSSRISDSNRAEIGF